MRKAVFYYCCIHIPILLIYFIVYWISIPETKAWLWWWMALFVASISFFCGMVLYAGEKTYSLENPLTAAIVMPIMLALIYTGFTNFGITSYSTGFLIIFTVAYAAIMGMFYPLLFMSNYFGKLLSGDLFSSERKRTCEKAEALEKRGEITQAEAAYREILLSTKSSSLNKRKNARVYLAYGNFLERQGRISEAIEQWILAVGSTGLETQQEAFTVIRCSDHLLTANSSTDRKTAVNLLQSFIKRHPKLKETSAIQARLNNLLKSE